MKHLSLFIISSLLLGFSACQDEPHFNVTGNITGAKGKTLYLEATGIDRITPLDSAKLGSSGAFDLQGQRPQTPEFYRLRIEDKIINLAIDSTETVGVKAAYKDMPVNYTVEGSEQSSKIKELAVMQIDLQSRIDKLYKERKLQPFAIQDSVQRMVARYKERIKMDYVYQAPNTLAAYFALFQRINNFLLFDPLNNKEDIRCFGAVATSFENLYPHSLRSKNLSGLVLKGMRNTRPPKQKELTLPAGKVVEAGLIDIVLDDQNGKEHKLTDLKGKVVLLDFTVYQNSASPARNMALRELYNKYHAQGLEIYQVSLDADEHYWKTSADHLPWICVRDPHGTRSTTATLYNIRELPTFFLINRNNELKLRSDAIQDLEKEIKNLL